MAGSGWYLASHLMDCGGDMNFDNLTDDQVANGRTILVGVAFVYFFVTSLYNRQFERDARDRYIEVQDEQPIYNQEEV